MCITVSRCGRHAAPSPISDSIGLGLLPATVGLHVGLYALTSEIVICERGMLSATPSNELAQKFWSVGVGLPALLKVN